MTDDVALEHQLAGTFWVPRIHVPTGVTHWYVKHELAHGGPASLVWCSQRGGSTGVKVSIDDLITVGLVDGVPCPECAAKWPLPGGDVPR